MYLKVKDWTRIRATAEKIARVATLETCGIPELVKLYNEDYRVRLWFDSWIVEQAMTIVTVIDENV